MPSATLAGQCSETKMTPEAVESALTSNFISYILSDESLVRQLEVIMSQGDTTRHYTVDIR